VLHFVIESTTETGVRILQFNHLCWSDPDPAGPTPIL
jgi:hypothetical protein